MHGLLYITNFEMRRFEIRKRSYGYVQGFPYILYREFKAILAKLITNIVLFIERKQGVLAF